MHIQLSNFVNINSQNHLQVSGLVLVVLACSFVYCLYEEMSW